MNQMYSRGKFYKNYTLFANEMREELRENAKKISEQEGIQIRFVNNRDRKESMVAAIMKKRGNSDGLAQVRHLKTIQQYLSCTVAQAF